MSLPWLFTVAVQIWGYDLTWLEIAAVVLTLIGVYLNTIEHIVAWPIAIVSTAIYAVLFFHLKLYGDFGLQFIFIASSVYGWYQWLYGGAERNTLTVTNLPRNFYAPTLVFVGVVWPALGVFFAKFTDTDVPYFDALPTTLSLAGQWMLARKYLQNWYLWILADVIYVVLFIYKAVYLTALLYALFIGLCAYGLREWKRSMAAAS